MQVVRETLKPALERRMRLRGRIRWAVGILMVGLILSGISALPLPAEMRWVDAWWGITATWQGVPSAEVPVLARWFLLVREGLEATEARYPFMYYGMDWLCFGHWVIAFAFVGAWWDPERNVWLFPFGLWACAMVVPFALIFGEVRGIPWWWRGVDCCFGLVGAVPLALGWRWTRMMASDTPPA